MRLQSFPSICFLHYWHELFDLYNSYLLLYLLKWLLLFQFITIIIFCWYLACGGFSNSFHGIFTNFFSFSFFCESVNFNFVNGPPVDRGAKKQTNSCTIIDWKIYFINNKFNYHKINCNIIKITINKQRRVFLSFFFLMFTFSFIIHSFSMFWYRKRAALFILFNRVSQKVGVVQMFMWWYVAINYMNHSKLPKQCHKFRRFSIILNWFSFIFSLEKLLIVEIHTSCNSLL